MNEEYLREEVRPRFSRALQRNEIYLANHSLGRPPDRAQSDVVAALDKWYSEMDGAWECWMREMDTFRSNIASLTGSEYVVPKSSAGQGLRAVLNALEPPVRVVTTTGEFDSLDFILRVYESRGRAAVTWVAPRDGELFDTADILEAINDETDLVVVSAVMYATGQCIDGLDALAGKAHERGALLLVDAYHAVGAVPFSLAEIGADFVVGGSYKYLRGGPGAAYLGMRETSLRTLDTGWFAKSDPFSFERSGEVEWGDAWLESTPPVLPVVQAKAGIELVMELGVENLRQHNLRQQAFLQDAFGEAGVPCRQPKDPSRFGAFTLVPHRDAERLVRMLRDQRVNVDSRLGNVRFCPDILNTDEELRDAAAVTASLL